MWLLNTPISTTPTFNKTHTVCVLWGRWAVNLRPEGDSPDDSVAVHSLAASGENKLEVQSQHFAQGCKETVRKRKGGQKRRREKGESLLQTSLTSDFIKTAHHITLSLTYFGCSRSKCFQLGFMYCKKISGTLKEFNSCAPLYFI